MAVSMQSYMAELERALVRSWDEDDLIRTMGRIKKISNGHVSLEDEIANELFYLRLRGETPEQEKLSDILLHYYQFLLQAWSVATEVHSVPVPAADLEMEIMDDDDEDYFDLSDYDDGMETEEDEPSPNPSGVLCQLKIRSCDRDEEEEEPSICSVCLEDLYKGLVATLECQHEFHANCIGRWLVRGQNFCPLCKARALR